MTSFRTFHTHSPHTAAGCLHISDPATSATTSAATSAHLIHQGLERVGLVLGQLRQHLAVHLHQSTNQASNQSVCRSKPTKQQVSSIKHLTESGNHPEYNDHNPHPLSTWMFSVFRPWISCEYLTCLERRWV